MGFDPRDWSAASHDGRGGSSRSDRVTSNVEALLRENDTLRREVQRLELELDRLRRRQWQRPRRETSASQSWQQSSSQSTPRITAAQVQRWGAALAEQTGWTEIRANGLVALIERLNRDSFHPELSLQQRLDRLVSGLGTDLIAAAGSRPTKRSTAVLAAFALYGVRASEWLDEDPARVVQDLLQSLRRARAANSGRRTRSDRRSTYRRSTDWRSTDREWRERDPRMDALSVLGLDQAATQDDIKQAFRRLVKQHHPDVGGSAEAFRRVNDAYQLLIS